MTTRLHRRGGFTLMELIIVIGIIILLMGLTAGAVFRLRASQMEKNTNTHLLKIHTALMQQYSAAADRIKKEDPPQVIKELTKNQDGTYDLARAKAIHMKMRMRIEFPQGFGEVFPTPVPPSTKPEWDVIYNGQVYAYVPKSSFRAALKNPVMVDIEERQSAALLVLILSQGQGGTATNPESIAPTKLIDFQQQNGPPVSLRVFVDEWGNPIAFRRWADDDMKDVLRELNQPPYVSAAQVQSGNMDPDDPEGRLRMTTWPGRPQMLTFVTVVNQDPTGRQGDLSPFDGSNRGPFVFSAGGNGHFWVPNTSPPAMETDLDNLYSYRLAQSGRGN